MKEYCQEVDRMEIGSLKEKIADTEVARKIIEITEANELQITMAEDGIEISMEEAEQAVDLLAKIRSGEVTMEQMASVQQFENGDELDEEALESVSGGFVFFRLLEYLFKKVF